LLRNFYLPHGGGFGNGGLPIGIWKSLELGARIWISGCSLRKKPFFKFLDYDHCGKIKPRIWNLIDTDKKLLLIGMCPAVASFCALRTGA